MTCSYFLSKSNKKVCLFLCIWTEVIHKVFCFKYKTFTNYRIRNVSFIFNNTEELILYRDLMKDNCTSVYDTQLCNLDV